MKKEYTKEEAEQLSLELQTEIVKLENALKSLSKNILSIQNGDEEGLFWDGKNATNINKSLIGHYEHNKVLLENVRECSEYIKSLIEK